MPHPVVPYRTCVLTGSAVIDAEPPEVAVLIGYGSIGRLHARALTGLAQRLVIVDHDPVARERAAYDHPSATISADLSAFDQWCRGSHNVLAVIATWGPSHALLFDQLADLGVRHTLCEKPLANSVAGADAMARRATRDGIALTSYHYFRSSGLIAALERLAEKFALGNPVAIVANGGAACLATNGLHWVDFAHALFKAAPRTVISTARNDRINPRSADLGYYGGSAVWEFQGGRELSLTFSNASSVYPMTHVHYRDAVVTLDYDYEVAVYRRDADEVTRFPAVTRTGPPRRMEVKGQLQGVLDGLAAVTTCLAKLWGGDVSLSPPEACVTAVGGVIGALVAAREGRKLELPLLPASAWGREEWPIS